MIARLGNGGLIIEKASEMNSLAVVKLQIALEVQKAGIVVILEDKAKAIKRMLAAYPIMNTFFNSHIAIEEIDNDAFVSYGKRYAASLGYFIDDLGKLTLLEQIEKRQTKEHVVTVEEVRKIVEDAIDEYSRAVTPPVRQTGNRLTGPVETACASLLA